MKQAIVAIYNDLVLWWKTFFNLWFSLPHTASYCIQSCRFSSLSISFSFIHDNKRHKNHTKHTFIYTAIYTHVLARWLKHVTIHRTHRVFLFLSFSFFPHIQEMDTFLFLESFSLFNFIVVFFIIILLMFFFSDPLISVFYLILYYFWGPWFGHLPTYFKRKKIKFNFLIKKKKKKPT